MSECAWVRLGRWKNSLREPQSLLEPAPLSEETDGNLSALVTAKQAEKVARTRESSETASALPIPIRLLLSTIDCGLRQPFKNAFRSMGL